MSRWSSFDEPWKNTEEITPTCSKQANIGVRTDLLPATALLQIAEVLKFGAEKYGKDNWRKIEVNDHINHAMTHILKHLSGDTTEEHLTHASARLLFALELHKLQQTNRGTGR